MRVCAELPVAVAPDRAGVVRAQPVRNPSPVRLAGAALSVREPPHSVEAEQAVLGAMLIDAGAWPEVSHLTASDFYRSDHRAIYSAMAHLFEEGRPVDVVTVAEQLERCGRLESAGGLAYLATIAQNTPSAANADAYAAIVRDRAARRAIIRGAADIQCAAFDASRPVRDGLAELRARLGAIAERIVPLGARTPLMSMSELLSRETGATTWLVSGLLPAGGLSLILGKPKAGKSTLARGLCMAVADGSTWLDRECACGPVVYVALEEKVDEVRLHFQTLGATAHSPIYSHVDRLPDDCKPVEWLRETVAHLNPALIVIDPLGRFVRLRDGGNDYTDATRQLEPLISYARDSNPQTHIALVHHSRKSAGEHGDESLGSTAILGSVDTAISLRREKGAAHRTIYSVNRYGEDLAETFAMLDADTGRVTLGTTKAEAAVRGIEDAILDCVASRSGPVAHQEILDCGEVCGARAKVLRTLVSLVNGGRLQRAGTGRRGDPHSYSIPHSPPV